MLDTETKKAAHRGGLFIGVMRDQASSRAG